MTEKTSRNEPCPCGTGKKYKKCCLLKDTLRGQYPERIMDWVLNTHKLAEKFETLVEKYVDEEPPDDGLWEMLLCGFIFEYKLPDCQKTPLELFIESQVVSEEEKKVLEDLKNSTCSFFKVLNVKLDEGITLLDLVTNTEYSVRERSGTHYLNPGNCIFARIAPFFNEFIIVSPVEKYSDEVAYILGRSKRYLYSGSEKLGFLNLIKSMTTEYVGDLSLDEVKKLLKKKLNKLGLKLDFRSLDRRVNKHTTIKDAFPEVFEFNYPSNNDFKEVEELLTRLWNKYPRREFGGSAPEELMRIGPKERMLIEDLTGSAQSTVDPRKYESAEKLQNAIDKFKYKWLSTSQEELDGKTPMEVILEERAALGNPNKKFHYRLEATPIHDYDLNKAEKLYRDGLDAYNKGAVGKAIELYEEVIKMYPMNYKAWCNLGCALATFGDKKSAIKCFTQAISIKPDYQLAKKNLKTIEAQTEEQLRAIGLAFILEKMAKSYDEYLKKREERKKRSDEKS